MTTTDVSACHVAEWSLPWRLYRSWAVIRSCSPARVGRHIVAQWYFVARDKFHVAVLGVAASILLLYGGAALSIFAGPDLLLSHQPAFAAWVTTQPVLGPLVLMLLALVLLVFVWDLSRLVVNSVLLLDHVLRLPFQLVKGTHVEWQAGQRSLMRMNSAFAPWLSPRSILIVYRNATAENGPTLWQSMAAADLLSQLLETHYDTLRVELPNSAWGELAARELAPSALAVILRHGLRGGGVDALILNALQARGAFSHCAHAPVLARELAKLPPSSLANVLGKICILDTAGQTASIRSLFAVAQRLERPDTDRFVEAIALVPLGVCEAAFAMMGREPLVDQPAG